jgi:hypothetical protein
VRIQQITGSLIHPALGGGENLVCLVIKGSRMARPLRIAYPGAVYHVVCRGNNRQNIFKGE